jgi:hypothetical protein
MAKVRRNCLGLYCRSGGKSLFNANQFPRVRNCGCRLKLMSNYLEVKLMVFPLYMTLIT